MSGVLPPDHDRDTRCPVTRASFELSEESDLSPSSRPTSFSLCPPPTDCSPGYATWQEEHPSPTAHFDEFMSHAAGKLVAVFLDYDGTLTPIVSNPDAAVMSPAARSAVCRLAQLFPAGIVSGRSRVKVQSFVQLSELFYAGSHGMDIVGPALGTTAAEQVAFQPAAAFKPILAAMLDELELAVASFPGAVVENNTFCLSVHFRNCDAGSYPPLLSVVEEAVARRSDQLRMTRGRKVLEIRPKLDWDKGAALVHLLDRMDLADPDRVFALYIGDDRTDEDAFEALADRGLGSGIVVSSFAKPTAACWSLHGPSDVIAFLEKLVAWGHTDANEWQKTRACRGWRIAASPTPSPPAPSLPPRQAPHSPPACASQPQPLSDAAALGTPPATVHS